MPTTPSSAARTVAARRARRTPPVPARERGKTKGYCLSAPGAGKCGLPLGVTTADRCWTHQAAYEAYWAKLWGRA